MNTDKKINPIRETDAAALGLARKLLDENRYAGLGVLEIGTGFPLVSRIAFAWSEETGLYFAASDLSEHSKCLRQDSRLSILVGEPGKGEGLAHPRITIVGQAERMPNSHELRARFRSFFVSVHPKAELYIDFADFGFYPVKVEKALLNGGFGKAYHLTAEELSFLTA